MRSILFAGAVVALTSCSKHDTLLRVDVQAECRMCAAQWSDRDGVLHRDTIVGLITWHNVDGIDVPDTARGTGEWQLSRLDGETLDVTLCHLRTDTADGDLVIHVSGDVDPLQAIANWPQECAVLDQPVAQH